MDDLQLLGLPLDTALERLAREGVHPEVEWTASPRGGNEAGEPRVVRARDGRLVVARFPRGIEAVDA